MRDEVVFAADKHYAPHLATAIYSLLSNNASESFRVSVINTDLDESDFNKLRQIADPFDCKLNNLKVSDDLFEECVLGHHFKKSNYYRLLIPELLNANRALYLDSDIVVLGSIKYLLDVNLQGKPVAAVQDPGFTWHSRLGMSENAGYFNSGVMILDLERWRRDSIASRVLEFVRAYPTAIQFVDQCGINAILNGEWLVLPLEYNVQSVFLSGDLPELHSDPTSILGNAKIVHFTGSSKPWQLNNKHPYKRHYWRYRNKTAYRNYLADDVSFINILRFITPNPLKSFVRRFR